jgi:hypothetical protein
MTAALIHLEFVVGLFSALPTLHCSKLSLCVVLCAMCCVLCAVCCL